MFINKVVQERIRERQDIQVKMVRNIPLSVVLKLEGNVRGNVEFFRKIWKNYETASALNRYTIISKQKSQ